MSGTLGGYPMAVFEPASPNDIQGGVDGHKRWDQAATPRTCPRSRGITRLVRQCSMVERVLALHFEPLGAEKTNTTSFVIAPWSASLIRKVNRIAGRPPTVMTSGSPSR